LWSFFCVLRSPCQNPCWVFRSPPPPVPLPTSPMGFFFFGVGTPVSVGFFPSPGVIFLLPVFIDRRFWVCLDPPPTSGILVTIPRSKLSVHRSLRISFCFNFFTTKPPLSLILIKVFFVFAHFFLLMGPPPFIFFWSPPFGPTPPRDSYLWTRRTKPLFPFFSFLFLPPFSHLEILLWIGTSPFSGLVVAWVHHPLHLPFCSPTSPNLSPLFRPPSHNPPFVPVPSPRLIRPGVVATS